MNLRTGIDLVEISRFDELDPAIRERFLKRVFTIEELAICAGRMEALAGRFAAKEAVAKALGCGIGAVSWQEIEIRQGAQGEPVLELHGEALRIAILNGLREWSISITHTRVQAAAVAVVVSSGAGQMKDD
jgi:holo-[acyl-carrier protein] synthase